MVTEYDVSNGPEMTQTNWTCFWVGAEEDVVIPQRHVTYVVCVFLPWYVEGLGRYQHTV